MTVVLVSRLSVTERPSGLPPHATKTRRTLLYHAYSLWLFTFSDLKTILVPKTAFGIITLLSGPVLTKSSWPGWLTIFRCLPLIMMWIWLNLLPLDMNNEHREDDVQEDKNNKPWRPIPAGRLSIEETKRLMLAGYIAAMLGSAYLGALPECLALIVQGWIYNELGAANGSYLTRNLLNATGYMTFAAGAAKVACIHSGTTMQKGAYVWLMLLGMVIATTIQFQDLYDQKGDRARGRRTVPLVLGDGSARLSVELPVAVWSLLCPAFWRLSVQGFILPVVLGAVIIFRLFRYRDVSADKTSFKIWNAWVVVLYLLPFLKAIA
ncbi:MAG: hypothetical protein ALECFALPRED_007327 [Alectoria fallacina]|uniref:Uncharacterized protein n=1 Tax=Alectoria fallacina TaxID=1903189 RepID=A0A8H3EQC5_9LECA|nr:MAG: hypothetical protein ALECFALPRED_007327 [Alectoria fallacina]